MQSKWNEFYVLPRQFQFSGIVLLGLVFLKKKSKSLKKKELAILLNHERIHVKQQLELLIIPFFVLYVIEWAVLYLKYGNNDQAYRNISFEKEAYDKAHDMEYLINRKPYFWLRHWQKAKTNV